jgi:predicted TIM-barrel fold metal-dependent hydrolase
MNRRTFLATSALGLAAARAAQADIPKPEPRYVDVHTHIGQGWGARPALTASNLLKWMDENGISHAVVMPLISPESFDYPISVDYVLTETQPHRDRLLPFCSIDPRTVEHDGVQRKVDMIKKYVDAGARGFGEHKVGVPVDDPRNLEIYHACGELKLPLLFHLDNVRNTDTPGLPGLANALRQCPDTTFIGHGPGWWAAISGDCTTQDLGGYPDGPVAPGGALDALMEQYPNLYGDLSAGSGAGAIARDINFGKAFLTRRADRMMFGTDYLAPGQGVPQLSLYAEIDLPEEVKAKVYRENAKRVLGIG